MSEHKDQPKTWFGTEAAPSLAEKPEPYKNQEIDANKETRPPEPEKNQVVITGIDIPMGDMVILLVNLAIAAIPAAFILFIISMGFFMVLGAFGLVFR